MRSPREKSIERAKALWPILVEFATAGTKISYGDLAEMADKTLSEDTKIGKWPRGYGPMRGALIIILNHCRRNNLPLLSIIVVRKQDGEPGQGIGKITETDFSRVRKHKWKDNSPEFL